MKKVEMIDTKTKNKTILVQQIVDEFYKIKPDIENRISQKDIEIIIDNEYKNRGITLNYEYAVIDNKTRIIYSSKEYKKNVSFQIFQTELFPNDISNETFYLKIYFPGEKNYLFKSLGVMVFSSIALTVAVIILLYCAVLNRIIDSTSDAAKESLDWLLTTDQFMKKFNAFVRKVRISRRSIMASNIPC